MSVRALAVVAPSRRWVKRIGAPVRVNGRSGSARRSVWMGIAHDRQLIGLKLILLSLVLLAAMAMEVPL